MTKNRLLRRFAPRNDEDRRPCFIPSVSSKRNPEVIMNEDVFNASLRKFLKKVGITSQREIEKAVRDALEAGRLKGNEKLPAKIVLTVGGVNLTHEVKDEIELG